MVVMITQHIVPSAMEATKTLVGIATLQRRPLDARSWMRYHKDVGVSHFYFWLEDSPEDLARVYDIGEEFGVTVYAEAAPSVDRSCEDNYLDLMTRQEAFVNRMIRKARIDGVDWLFHLDDDELLYVHDDGRAIVNVLDSVSPSFDCVHFKNWEGFSPSRISASWYKDRGVRYLPCSCSNAFSAYSNGKSATRTKVGQRFYGPHHFTGREFKMAENTAVVLHHDGLAMSEKDVPPELWVRKNTLRIKSDLSKIPFKSTHDAVKALVSKDPSKIWNAWKKHRSQDGAMFKLCKEPRALNLLSYEYKDE